MVLVRPVKGADILAEDFGQPVYDWIAQYTEGGWTAFTLPAGLIPYPNFAAPAYRKVGRSVQIRGVWQVQSGTVPSGDQTPCGNTPVGMRPLAVTIVAGICGVATSNIARFDLRPDGQLLVQPGLNLTSSAYFTVSASVSLD